MNIAEIRQQYPQYNDLTDDQLSHALHAKFYSDMPYEQFTSKIGAAQPQQQERSVPQSIARQLGLTARAALSGLGDISNIILDPTVKGINALAGTNLPIPSQAMERTLDRGLPVPASDEEQFANRVARGMVPAAASAKAASLSQTFAPLAANPGTQIASAGAAGGGAELARQAGGDEWDQTMAALGAGVAAPTSLAFAKTGGQAAARLGRNVTAPLTEQGRNDIVARVLQQSASNPQQAAQNIRSAPAFVPGVAPLTAEVADDVGLAGLHKTLRNQNTAPFADIEQTNDAARQAALLRSFGSPTDLQMAQTARNEITTPMRQAAFENAKAVNTKPIVTTADRILSSGAGKRQEVEKAMSWVKDRLEGERDPARIYAVRQDINDIIAGKLAGDPEKASLKLAANELKAIRGVLDAQLEKSAPGFKSYLQQYADRSRTIDAMATGQEIAASALNPSTERLSPAMFARQMQRRAEDVANSGAIGSDVLTRMSQDLKRSTAPMNAMRTPGSDTLQNLAGTETITRMLGHAPGGMTTRLAAKGLGMLYSPFEAKTRELLLDAALHPQVAAGLLSRPIPQNPDLTLELLAKLLPISYGGLLGTTTGIQ